MEPAVYRRRSDLVEAVQVTSANAIGLAEELGGRVDWLRGERPLLHVPKSMAPARVGDYICRDVTRDQPWYPYRRDLFEDAYEPAACPGCGTVPGG